MCPNHDFPGFFDFPTAVTLRLLNGFRRSWYLGCVARAGKLENGIDYCVAQFLIGVWVPGVSGFRYVNFN